ncbi:hypothetical protein BDZ97DRAFT_1825507 [Flammula alnicola]|nr:hypothetical protein BDZ97DRAFT_1825507 [Flammula alnicola]
MSQLGQEVYDLSGWKGTRFSFDGSVPQNDRRGSENSSAGLTYRNQTANGLRVSVPFPKNTRGVLYLHLPSGHSDISAQIRFRICDDVASFKQGVDLRNDITEEPWSVSLYSIAKFRRYNAFLRLLLEQGLVDVDLISDIRNLPFRRLSSCLYDLNQPFIFDVSVNAPQFSLMTRRSLEIIRLFGLLRDDRPTMDIHQTPYTGLIRVCFELSTLPEHVAEGPTLLLRILDIIKPVQCVIEGYDNYIAFPEAETFGFWGAFYTFIQNSKSMRGHNDTPRLKSSTSV